MRRFFPPLFPQHKQVRFLNGRVKAIHPQGFSEAIVGVGSTCRIQMPLRIAFAISIHKVSQSILNRSDRHVSRVRSDPTLISQIPRQNNHQTHRARA
jgi:hypothetical protein